MKFTASTYLALLGSAFFFFDSAIAAPVPEGNRGDVCAYPLTVIRKEWRNLSNVDKKSYTDAVKCLATKPSKANATFSGAVTRFDDFVAIHSSQTDSIHWVGHFLPWHRYLIHLYEKALRSECGYTGAQPYWDWTLDTNSGKPMNEWPIFDTEFGFGGNGPLVPVSASQNPQNIIRNGGGCVATGPFKYPGFTLNIGPSKNTNISNPHCLKRDFSANIAGSNLVSSVVDDILLQTDFAHFARKIEGNPTFDVKNVHRGGHIGIGGVLGTMADIYNSPGDPLFYLHHVNIDRLWWQWQKQRIFARTTDISGPSIPFDYTNVKGPNITLEFPISLSPVGENVLVKELMHIQGGMLCYDYQ
ncbi:hypothetical protein DFH27DRAFT_315579 [Peziza echinospora]|nr:hypothetical protein DFH27DRAFT_315579 [Peziza echinospora]